MDSVNTVWSWARHMALTLIPWSQDPNQPSPFHVESVSYWTLNVTVLRATTNTSQDYWSESDLYVSLTLPTATASTRRTRSINNNNNPVWNEGFSFRVPVQTKNILEIRLCDEDLISGDDLVFTVLLDLSSLEMDSKTTRSFRLGPQLKEVLELEFELKSSEEAAQDYPSNGILMAAPLSVLKVRVQNLQNARYLNLSGAYEGTQALDPLKDNLHFHMNRELETELGLTEVKVSKEADEQQEEVLLSCVPLKLLPHRHSAKVSLTLEEDTVDLHLQLFERSKEQLGVRLSLDVPAQEKDFLQKRRKTVARALQTLLGLDSPPSDTQVPTIAVVASGGGARASTGFLGSLKGLKEIGVLDTVTYTTILSGSTWAMSTLCQDENWSQNLETLISENKKQMTKSTMSAFSLEKMNYYWSEMDEKEKQGHLVSYIDMAGLILEHFVFGQKNSSTLSEQKKTVKNGQNPLPIYTAVNVKEAVSGIKPEAEWVEFTPFEVGLQKYGAFISAEDFGSEFFLGHFMKKLPEIRLPFLMGIWSSVFSLNLTSLWRAVTGSAPEWTPEHTEVDSIGKDNHAATLHTLRLRPESGLGASFCGFFKNRPIINETFNFTRGLSLHQKYGESSNFQAGKESHPDAFPNRLTPSDPTLHLVDSGHAINIGCPPVLRPERHVDIIIVLSYSWDPQNIFLVMQKTSEFCEEHSVAFPTADYSQLQEQPQEEVYVFEDPEKPTAPIVLFLPLVNASYSQNKAPGVRRETEQELAAGQVDVSSSGSPYTTDHMTYSEADYDALIDLSSYNVLQSRDTILSALSRALSRGREGQGGEGQGGEGQGGEGRGSEGRAGEGQGGEGRGGEGQGGEGQGGEGRGGEGRGSEGRGGERRGGEGQGGEGRGGEVARDGAERIGVAREGAAGDGAAREADR